MLPKYPNFQRDEPATSPALSRRRDHMLHSDKAHPCEPRLIPDPDEAGPSFTTDMGWSADDEFDAEIPPPPSSARPPAADTGTERPVRPGGRLRLLPFAAAALALIGLGGMTWLVYDLVTADAGSGEVPYVMAETGPEKIRPQDEGGLDVPNQDISVYNELNGAPARPEAEVLLPAPEVPVSPPVVAEQPTATESADIPSVPAPVPDPEPAAGYDAPPAETATAAPADQSEPVTEESAVTTAESRPAEEPVQAAAVAAAFRIQLAAVKSREAAQLGWTKISKAHPDVLGPLALNILKVDRSGGSALYRLQAGPFADRAAAEAACAQLKRQSQDCLVVAP